MPVDEGEKKKKHAETVRRGEVKKHNIFLERFRKSKIRFADVFVVLICLLCNVLKHHSVVETENHAFVMSQRAMTHLPG